MATYFTLKVNFVTSVLTYGVVFGLGCGIAYPMPVTCAMRVSRVKEELYFEVG